MKGETHLQFLLFLLDFSPEIIAQGYARSNSSVIAQEWVFIVSWHCHQMFHIFFYLKSVKNAKIGDFWGLLGISTFKSGNTVKSGNFGHFPNVARWFKFKITKNWSKTPKSAIFWKIHIQIWWCFWILIIKQFFTSNWSTIVTAAAVVAWGRA